MADWLDKKEYPFAHNYLELPMGRLHYVDEGKGDHALVMVHGNPSWSFCYRHLVKGLSDNYRCIAADHIGFGLSDKPSDWSYLPEDHAANLEALLLHLNLKKVTLIVQDWGGPIGLSLAVKYPEIVNSLVIMNTWMWSMKGDSHFEKFSGLMGGPVGRFMIKKFNFFVRVAMKQAYGDKSKLTKQIHSQYLNVHVKPEERKGCWVFPKQIIGSSQWLNQLWEQRSNFVDKPALVVWGKKDIAFRKKELDVWKNNLHNAEIVEFENIGHYVQEELGIKMTTLIKTFLLTSK